MAGGPYPGYTASELTRRHHLAKADVPEEGLRKRKYGQSDASIACFGAIYLLGDTVTVNI